MIELTMDTDGDYKVPGDNNDVRAKEATSFKILDLPSGVSLTVGCFDSAGLWHPFSDGGLSIDTVLDHGSGIKLGIRAVGITTVSARVGCSE